MGAFAVLWLLCGVVTAVIPLSGLSRLGALPSSDVMRCGLSPHAVR